MPDIYKSYVAKATGLQQLGEMVHHERHGPEVVYVPPRVDPKDAAGKDDVQTLNDLHVPLVKLPNGHYKPVIIFVSSKDVIHSFKVIALRMTQDAIPGMRIPLWFEPTEEGRFQINCAQLCGNGHSSMAGGFLTVESQEKYDKWLASKAGAATSFE